VPCAIGVVRSDVVINYDLNESRAPLDLRRLTPTLLAVTSDLDPTRGDLPRRRRRQLSRCASFLSLFAKAAALPPSVAQVTP
jgi:hypothetical protein